MPVDQIKPNSQTKSKQQLLDTEQHRDYITSLETQAYSIFTPGEYLLSFRMSLMFQIFHVTSKEFHKASVVVACFFITIEAENDPEVAHSIFLMSLQHEAEETAAIRGSFAYNNRDARGCLTDGMLLTLYGGICRLH